MKLDGIKPLYKNMRALEMTRYRFDFTFHKKTFYVLYFVDEEPHKIAIGIKSHNFYFEREVRVGYKINPILESEDYKKLCEILGFKYNKDSPFSTKIFFEKFNASIPKTAKLENYPEPHETALCKRDIEDSKKIYFMGWLDNKIRGNKVSEDNLKKTMLLLSKEAYEMCKEKNISTRWSDKPTDARKFNIKELKNL